MGARRFGYGVVFVVSLVTSWIFTTGLAVLAVWSGPRTLVHTATWAALWVFTVAAPTVQAVQIQRQLNDVLVHCPAAPPRIQRELAHARFVAVMCGSMTVLLVFGMEISK